ncbi:MAG: tRNA (N6-isopentenyl adenosine(37)-C2)-methylthiotransferase MiaB [Deltaproteobacteria bacterium]|nr:tRNA (N6-isopentenyl adenosine(37)-C2)-methylthiotransferase MiaB [Deltaproteobacteria bacterium]
MNVYDSARMENLLKPLGYHSTDDMDSADLILFNTCTVREKAKHKLMSEIGKLKELKQKKEVVLAIGGCVAQEEAEKLFRKAPHIDIVFGVDQIDQLPQLISQVREHKTQISLTAFDTDPTFSLSYLIPDRCPTSAYVTIIKGCDKFCSFCIVPMTRGLEKSRSPQEIIGEIQKLVQGGTQEVTLLGQNVNSYDYKKIYFPELLRKVDQIPGLRRIRFTSPHPQDFNDEMISCYVGLPRLCKHLHLPVQSGNNDVLHRMRRWYTVEDYVQKINKLREAVPAVSVSTDIIVGFPGETLLQFENTLHLLETVNYDFVYSFKYSERSGTRAARDFEDDVPEAEKERRLAILQRLQDRISLHKNKMLEGTLEEVLIEKQSLDGKLQGRTDSFKIVHFEGNPSCIGQFKMVRLDKALPHSFLGTALDQQRSSKVYFQQPASKI